MVKNNSKLIFKYSRLTMPKIFSILILAHISNLIELSNKAPVLTHRNKMAWPNEEIATFFRWPDPYYFKLMS